MSDVGQIVADMVAYGMPPLPVGHPVLDGKYHRFGPQKKGWYILREMTLKSSGRTVVTGAYGYFVGDERNTVPVKVDSEAMSDEEREEYTRQQRATEAAENERRETAMRLAANRAQDQLNKAAGIPVEHPYLLRKQVPAEGLMVSHKGLLLVPLRCDGKLVGLQKIDPAGGKTLSTDMNAIGASHVLGILDGAPIIGVGEGYATCASARKSLAPGYDLPVAMAVSAGNIMAVAKALRAEHPDAHLLILADDDYLIAERFAERLLKEFQVSQAVPIDGTTHKVAADDGVEIEVTAWWRTDPQGVEYIETDIRGRSLVRNYKYKNAGRAACHAAAAAVGNASVALPLFAARGGRKLTDFNDLHIAEGIEAVAAQISSFILAAQQLKTDLPVVRPAPQERQDNAPELVSAGDSPRPPDAECEPRSGRPRVESPPASSSSPPPSEGNAPGVMTGIFSLEWAIAHCALVQGSTDVWDSVNKLRMKRAAFADMVGKAAAAEWTSHAARRNISPRNLPRTVRGVAVQDGGAGADNIVMMLDRYTLLYGTKNVYDAEKRSIIGYDAMALARGSDLAARWLSHPLHLEKDYDKVVFDPTQRVDLNTHINLFEGFPLKPRKDDAKVDLVLDLLWSLCATERNREDVFNWVLRWLAYPLQHPGAKMQTALLFFGEKQGTGKSLFFEGIVKPIYGAHGATGGQHQLEGTYTMWRSQKLFVLFEEILSRQDKYSYFGLIKHMITGRDTPISQKFKDDRTEANHMNVVMLSNEFQAVPIEPEDRRFLVVDVRQALDAELLAKIKAQLEHGLIEAFYAFLLTFPLLDFDAHTKPIMTAAKERVISFGRPDWESFYMAWSSGELSAPYCTCLSTDLYLVFSRYASRFGLRSMSMTKFNEMIGQRLRKDRAWVSMGASTTKRLLSVFYVPYVAADGDTQATGREGTVSEQCAHFRDRADVRADA